MQTTRFRSRALVTCSSVDYDTLPASDNKLLNKLTQDTISHLAAAGIEGTIIDSLHLYVDPQKALDGYGMLVVMGGLDVYPELYGQKRDSKTETSPDRGGDDFEIGIIRHAIESGKCVFGICRGMQLLNVACGGTLIQALDPKGPHYDAKDPVNFRDHFVCLENGSRLAGMLNMDRAAIRSAHHQAVKKVGKGLRVVATSEDGVIEAIEMDSDNLVLGVQWHPEEVHADPKQLNAIFKTYAQKLGQHNQ